MTDSKDFGIKARFGARYSPAAATIICSIILAAALVFLAPGAAFAENGEDEVDDPAASDVENATEVSLTLVSAPESLNVGERAVIGYDLKGADSDTVINWNSSNDSVAAVDSKGEVTASSPGSVEITASVPSLGLRASTMIKVAEIAATSVKIGVREYSAEDMLLSIHDITVDDELHLYADVEPENVTIAPAIQWSSNDEDILTVDANGVVAAIAEGEATVTATAGELTDRIKFNVVPPPQSNIDKYLLIGFGVIVALIIAFLAIIITRAAKRRRIEREGTGTRPEAAGGPSRKPRTRKAENKYPPAASANRQTRVFAPTEGMGPDSGAYDDAYNNAYNDEPPIDALPEETPPKLRPDELGGAKSDYGDPLEGYEEGPDRPFSLEDID